MMLKQQFLRRWTTYVIIQVAALYVLQYFKYTYSKFTE